MRNKYFKIIILLCVLVFFVFVVPIYINYLYKVQASLPIFAMEWEAKDVLSYYGSLLGAGATIYALTATISFTIKSQKEERKLSVKPRLYSKCTRITDEIFSNLDDEIIFIEYSEKSIIASKIIPIDIKKLLELNNKIEQYSLLNSPNDIEKYQYEENIKELENKYFKLIKENCIVPYNLFNCGANSAVEVNFRINNRSVLNEFFVPVALPQKFIIIFNQNIIKDDVATIKITLSYSDICSLGKYKQEESFELHKGKEAINLVRLDNFSLSDPIEL